MKSIRRAVFNLPRSQAIFCIGYNVNLQTAVAAIVVFVECPKSIASEVLVVLRPYQKVEPYRQAVFKISRSQAIVDRRTGPFQSFDIPIKNIGIYTIAHLFSLAKMAQVDEVPLFV